MADKIRVIQESVPGKQVTIAHIIASPNQNIYEKIGMQKSSYQSLGILTITPSEAAIVASDIATKAAPVRIVFLDRFNGSIVIEGDVTGVEATIESVLSILNNQLGIKKTIITRT